MRQGVLILSTRACFSFYQLQLVWPNTGCPKMWAVALVVQQPLKVLSQILQTAIIGELAPPFLAFDEVKTVKYCLI